MAAFGRQSRLALNEFLHLNPMKNSSQEPIVLFHVIITVF